MDNNFPEFNGTGMNPTSENKDISPNSNDDEINIELNDTENEDEATRHITEDEFNGETYFDKDNTSSNIGSEFANNTNDTDIIKTNDSSDDMDNLSYIPDSMNNDYNKDTNYTNINESYDKNIDDDKPKSL